MPISVNYGPLMFINYHSFYCIKTNITPDQLMNHATCTWSDIHNLISLQYSDYTDHLLFIGHLFMTPMPFEQNKHLTLIGTVERVSNYTGLHDCSVFSSLEQKVLMVSYCDRPLSVVRRPPLCIVH